MGAVLKTLQKHCPCLLVSCPWTLISCPWYRDPHSKTKRYWESGCRGTQKNVSLRSKTEILGALWLLRDEGVWVWHHWVNMNDGFIPAPSWTALTHYWASEREARSCCEGIVRALMRLGFRNWPSSWYIPLRTHQALKDIVSAYFPQRLNLIMGSHLAPPGTRVSQTAGSTCSLISWGMFWGIFWCPTGASSRVTNRCILCSRFFTSLDFTLS